MVTTNNAIFSVIEDFNKRSLAQELSEEEQKGMLKEVSGLQKSIDSETILRCSLLGQKSR